MSDNRSPISQYPTDGSLPPETEQRLNDLAEGKSQVTPTTMYGWVSDRVQLLGEAYNRGEDSFWQSLGYVPSALGAESFEAANSRLNDESVARMKAAKMNLLEKAVPPGDVVRLVLPAFQSMAYSKRMWEAGSLASIAGGGLGAAAGAALGTAAAAPTGELAAPATLPPAIVGGATIGSALAGTSATFVLGANVALGSTWKRLKEAGVPDERARQLAIANGMVQGGIETMQTMLLGGIAKTAFSPVLKTPAGKALARNAILNYFKSIGLEGLEEGVQSLADDLVDEWSNEPSIKPKEGDYWKHFLSNTIEGAQAAVVLGGVAAGAGKATRAIGDKIADSKYNNSFVQTVREIIQSRRAAEAEAKRQREEEIAKMKVEAQVIKPAPVSSTKLGEALSDDKIPPTSKARRTADKAEADRVALKDKEKDLLKDIADHVIKGNPVPESLRKELKDTRRELREAVRDKERAEAQDRKDKLDKKFTDKNVSEVEKAQLAQEIGDLNVELSDIKLKQAQEEANDRLDLLDIEIAEREVELETQRDLEDDQVIEERYKAAEAKRKSLSADIDALQDKMDVRMASGKIVPSSWNNKMKDLKVKLKEAREEKSTARMDRNTRADLENRLADAVQEREALVDQMSAMQQGLLTGDDVDVIDRVKLGNKQREVIWRVINNVLNVIRKQKALTTESVGENFALLRDYITASNLSKESQAKLLGMLDIKKFKDAESLQKNLSKLKLQVSELLAKEAHDKAVKRLDRALKLIQPAKNDNQSRSKFSPEVQKILDIYEEFIEDTDKALAAYLDANSAGGSDEEIIERHTRGVIAGHVLNVDGLRLAAKVKALEDKLERLYQNFATKEVMHADGSTTTVPTYPLLTLSPQFRGVLNKQVADTKLALRKAQAELLAQQAEHINKLTDRILKLNRIGRDARIEAKTEEMNADRAFAAEAIFGANGDNPDRRVDISDPAAEEDRIDKGLSKAVDKWLRTAGKDEFSWEGKLRIIFQDMKNPKQLVSRLNRIFVDAGRSYDTNKRTQLDALMDHLVATTGMKRKDILKRMVKGASDKVQFTYIRSGSLAAVLRTGRLNMTKNEAIQLYIQMLDPSLHRGLTEGNGYSLRGEAEEGQSTQELLENELDNTDKQMAAALLNFYRDQYDRLNEEYEKATGLQLDFNEFYSGIAYRDGFTPDQINTQFQAQLQSMTAFAGAGKNVTGKPSNTISRVDSAKPLLPKDAFTNVVQSIQLVEHYRAWREPSQRLSAVLDNSDFQNVVRLKYGGKMLTAVLAHYQDASQDAVLRDYAWSDAINTIMRNYTQALLALKPLQYIKQLTSITNFLLVINEKELLDGILDFMEDPDRAIQVLSSSEIFKNRYANFDLQKAGAALNSTVKGLSEKEKRDALMVFLRAGDRHAVLLGGWAVYKASYDKTQDAGHAMQAFEDAFDTTQSSGNVDQLSNLSRNPATRLFMLFLQQPTRMWEFFMTSARDAANNPSKENLYNVFHTAIVINASAFLFGMVGFAWSYFTADDDDERDKALWQLTLDVINSNFPPLVGDMVSAYAAVTYNVTHRGRDRRVYDLSIPVLEVANESFMLYKEILEGMVKRDFDQRRLLKIWMLYARSVNMIVGGLPLEPIGSAVKEFFHIKTKKKRHYHIDPL